MQNLRRNIDTCSKESETVTVSDGEGPREETANIEFEPMTVSLSCENKDKGRLIILRSCVYHSSSVYLLFFDSWQG